MSRAAVITPTYKGKNYLSNVSVPAVLAQTFTEWSSYIIHDGPEKDDTAEYIKSLNEPRIHYESIPRVIPEPPNGYFFGHNDGWFQGHNLYNICGFSPTNYARKLIAKTDCEYVFIINQDDYWFPNHLEVLIRTLDNNKDHYIAWPVCLKFDVNVFQTYMGTPYDKDKLFQSAFAGPAWSSIGHRIHGPHEKFVEGPQQQTDWEWLKKTITATNKPALYVPQITAILFNHCSIEFCTSLTQVMNTRR